MLGKVELEVSADVTEAGEEDGGVGRAAWFLFVDFEAGRE